MDAPKVKLRLGAATPRRPVVREVVGGPYLVYRNAGQIVRLGDPVATVPASGQVSAAVTTSDGTLWVSRSDGALCQLPKGAARLACPAQIPQGHKGSLSV